MIPRQNEAYRAPVVPHQKVFGPSKPTPVPPSQKVFGGLGEANVPLEDDDPLQTAVKWHEKTPVVIDSGTRILKCQDYRTTLVVLL